MKRSYSFKTRNSELILVNDSKSEFEKILQEFRHLLISINPNDITSNENEIEKLRLDQLCHRLYYFKFLFKLNEQDDFEVCSFKQIFSKIWNVIDTSMENHLKVCFKDISGDKNELNIEKIINSLEIYMSIIDTINTNVAFINKNCYSLIPSNGRIKTILDCGFSKLFHFLKNILGGYHFLKLLEGYFQKCRSRYLMEVPYSGKNKINLDMLELRFYSSEHSPIPLFFVLMHKLQYPIYQEMFCVDFIKQQYETYWRSDEILIDQYYIVNLRNFMKSECYVLEKFSSSLKSWARTTILASTILHENNSYKILENSLFYNNDIQDINFIANSYTSLKSFDKFFEILKAIILTGLIKNIKWNTIDWRYLLELFVYLSTGNKYDTLPKIFASKCLEGVGSSVKLIDILVRLINQNIQRSYCEVISSEKKQLFLIEFLQVCSFTRLLDLESQFIDSFTRKYFKRIILLGERLYQKYGTFMISDKQLMNNLNKMGLKKFLEYSMIIKYQNATTSDNLYQFEQLFMSINKSVECSILFSKGNHSTFEFVPFLIDARWVPKEYKNLNMDISILPSEMMKIWNLFETFYRKENMNSDKKIIELQYALHYVEIETQFPIQIVKDTVFSKTNLILELNILQACILNLFNEKDEWKISEICDELKLSSSKVTPSITAFVNIGLMKIKDTSILSINDSFSPDKKKIKNGTLRIPLLKSGADTI